MKRKTGRPKGKPAVVDAAKTKRLQTALDLRVTGMSMEQIAERLGVDVSTVSRDLSAALGTLAAAVKGKALELVQLEVSRCDEIIRSLWPKRSTPTVAEKLVKVIDRKAKLLGLDAAQKHALSDGSDSPTAPDFGPELAAELEKLAKKPQPGGAPRTDSEPDPGAKGVGASDVAPLGS